MILDADNQLLVLSLADQILDELPRISSFMNPEDYGNLYRYTKSWKSKKYFLKKFFFDKINLIDDNLDFPLQLECLEESHHLSDTLALIPIEFQYLKTLDTNHGFLFLRLYINPERVKVAYFTVTEDLLMSMRNCLKEENLEDIHSNLLDVACFSYIKKFSKDIIAHYGKEYDSWDSFLQKFDEEHPIQIEEYDSLGRYLWQLVYLCFDNRKQKDNTIYTLTEQLQNYQLEQLDNIEILTASKKRKFLLFKSLFKDEHGNYWKSEKEYLRYKDIAKKKKD